MIKFCRVKNGYVCNRGESECGCDVGSEIVDFSSIWQNFAKIAFSPSKGVHLNSNFGGESLLIVMHNSIYFNKVICNFYSKSGKKTPDLIGRAHHYVHDIHMDLTCLITTYLSHKLHILQLKTCKIQIQQKSKKIQTGPHHRFIVSPPKPPIYYLPHSDYIHYK